MPRGGVLSHHGQIVEHLRFHHQLFAAPEWQPGKQRQAAPATADTDQISYRSDQLPVKLRNGRAMLSVAVSTVDLYGTYGRALSSGAAKERATAQAPSPPMKSRCDTHDTACQPSRYLAASVPVEGGGGGREAGGGSCTPCRRALADHKGRTLAERLPQCPAECTG